MSSVINTNVTSLNAQRNMLKSSAELKTSMERLSTGLRINSAKDDAAGLAISQRMTGQIRSMNTAVRNANDGISMVQAADASLQVVTNNLSRIRELAVQATSDANTSSDRAAISGEGKSLLEEIDRVTGSASFNGRKLLDGTGGTVDLQVGAGAGAGGAISVKLPDLTAATLGVADLALDTAEGAGAAIKAIDSAMDNISRSRADFGAVQNRFLAAISSTSIASENLSSARSRIQDTDFATETATMTRSQILNQAGVAMLSQANQAPQSVLALLRG